VIIKIKHSLEQILCKEKKELEVTVCIVAVTLVSIDNNDIYLPVMLASMPPAFSVMFAVMLPAFSVMLPS